MVVRIRFGKGVKVSRKRRKNQRVASNFAISSGIFSHWHVWVGAAALLQFCAYRLNRYGKSGDTAAP
ncbi:MAG: hypothetical protein ABSH45_02350 [Bryobacteraceae bacterium]